MKLVITAAAEADLRQIGDWIAHDSRASGLAFTDDLRDRAAIIVIAARRTVMASSVDLGRQLEAYVDMLVKVGRYNSKSEVLREGVRLVQEREAPFAALDGALARGLADIEAGRVHDVEEVRTHLRERFRTRAKRKRA
jgi:antitoxin ParD1/3/4